MKKGKDYIYHVDYLERTVHILELNQRSQGGLINQIDPSWQHRFIDDHHLLQDVYEFEWYIYSSNGMVTKYRNYNLSFVNDFTKLYKDFIDLLAKNKDFH